MGHQKYLQEVCIKYWNQCNFFEKCIFNFSHEKESILSYILTPDGVRLFLSCKVFVFCFKFGLFAFRNFLLEFHLSVGVYNPNAVRFNHYINEMHNHVFYQCMYKRVETSKSNSYIVIFLHLIYEKIKKKIRTCNYDQ
jgi:hypothetical protein